MTSNMNADSIEYPLRKCALCPGAMPFQGFKDEPNIVLHVECEQRLYDDDPERHARFDAASKAGRDAEAMAVLRELRA